MKKLGITLEDGSRIMVQLTDERLAQVKQYLETHPLASMNEAVLESGRLNRAKKEEQK